MRYSSSLACGLLLAIVSTAQAASSTPPASGSAGIAFSHNDWAMACDNTRTCRAAGYQADDEDLSVSLLLTRKAGPGTPVHAQVVLGDYGDEAEASSGPALGAGRLKLSVNGQALGTLPWLRESEKFGLNPAQLRAVLKALPRPHARIEFSHGRNVWRLSDQGAAAVLLKMDEFQGRIGTPSALARPGTRAERQALPPLPMPVVKAAKLPKLPKGRTGEQELGLSPDALAALRNELLKETDGNDDLSADSDEGKLSFEPLGGGKWMVSTLCWRAAYNEGSCMWVMNDRPPYQRQLVTDSASGSEGGKIWSSHKSRGLGDCWYHEEWVWDGSTFVHTSESSTGQCKLVTPGGAWDLPTLVTKVVKP